MKIAVLGAGSWGTALGQVLVENGHDVLLWHLEQDFVDGINQSHTHPFLPGVNLSHALQFTASLDDIFEYGVWINGDAAGGWNNPSCSVGSGDWGLCLYENEDTVFGDNLPNTIETFYGKLPVQWGSIVSGHSLH